MSLLWKIKPIINKNNKQVNLSIPKKNFPPELRKLLLDKPHKIKLFKLKFKGYE